MLRVGWLSAVMALCLACGPGQVEDAPSCQQLGSCEVGEPCLEHGECGGGLCLLQGGEDGVCAEPCDDEDACGPGRSCGLVAVSREGLETVEGTCVATRADGGDLGSPCADGADCRTGICHEGECTELCTACDGAECEPTSLSEAGHVSILGACRWAVAAADLRLGGVDVGLEGSEPVSFQVPDGLASFTIVIRDGATDFDQRIGITSLVAPDGTVLLDDSDPELIPINPPAIRYPQASAVLVPNSDDAAAAPQAGEYTLTAGMWEIDFEAEDPFVPVEGTIESIDVTFEPATERGGLVDLNVFTTPSMADEVDDDYVALMVASINSYYVGAGIEMGEVSLYDLPEEAERMANSESIRELCRANSLPGPRHGSVNIFLVQEIAFALGFTGGSPSPPGIYGVAASGIVAEKGGTPGRTGLLVAHELGHFLGLRHTTDFSQPDGGSLTVTGHDPLSDTPECAAGVALESCPDRDNLMFPTIHFGADLSLTPAQLAVVAGSSLAYELPRPARCAATSATYDITAVGAASGDTSSLPAVTAGSCGGELGPDRVHIYRVGTDAPARLDFTVRGLDFDPVLIVRKQGCDAEELGCATGAAGEEVTVSLEDPGPGVYFVIVDAADTGGIFHLRVEPSNP